MPDRKIELSLETTLLEYNVQVVNSRNCYTVSLTKTGQLTNKWFKSNGWNVSQIKIEFNKLTSVYRHNYHNLIKYNLCNTVI